MFFQIFIRRFFVFLLFIVTIAAGNFAARAQNAEAHIGLDPSRIEVVIPAGTERTFGATVEYSREDRTKEVPLARLIARMQDWTIEDNGEVKFVEANTLPGSASSWVTFGPSEFTLAADKKQIVRFTVSVPKNTKPGDYYFAIYTENRLPPPPPTEFNSKRINVSFRYYTMVYVQVPGLTNDGELLALDAKVVNGTPVLTSKFGNKGNSRVRPKHTVEIRDHADKTVFKSDPTETRVVLGGHTIERSYPIDNNLPEGDYKLVYTVDFGDKKALQIGKANFSITKSDIAARQQIINKQTAANSNDGKDAAVNQTAAANKTAAAAPTAPIAPGASNAANTSTAPIVNSQAAVKDQKALTAQTPASANRVAPAAAPTIKIPE